MSATINEFEPKEFTQGTTVKWKKSLADYSSADWTLKYSFRNSSGTGFDLTAAADGSSYLITIPIATTQSLEAGVYSWQAHVENAGASEKYIVDSGQITLLQNFAALGVNAPVDGRSEVKKILDAIDALVLGKATLDQQEYTIGTRQLKRIPISELLSLRTKYAQLYANELRGEKLKQGAPYFKNINTRFVEAK